MNSIPDSSSNVGGLKPPTSESSLQSITDTCFSESERRRILEAFQPRAAQFRRLAWVQSVAVLACVGLGFGGAISGAALDVSWVMAVGTVIGLISFIALFGALVLQRRWLRCPACDRRLIDVVGPYCPACGHQPLGSPDPCAFVPVSPCAACGSKIHWGRGHDFRLRHCTHCGVLLHEEGLPA